MQTGLRQRGWTGCVHVGLKRPKHRYCQNKTVGIDTALVLYRYRGTMGRTEATRIDTGFSLYRYRVT